MPNTAFISYAHGPDTRRAATRLATRLRRDGVTVWFDQWNLQPGQAWQPAISSALEQAGVVLAVVGKSDRGKDMLQKELEAAIKQNKTVIPILTDDADFDDIPELIRDRQAVSPSNDPTAYRQLLRALGKTAPEPDELEALSVWQRLRRYLANE